MLQYSTQSQGDTQPASQWVYDRCTKDGATHDPDTTGLKINGEAFYSQNGFSKDVETGQIDLLGAFEQPTIHGPSDSNGSLDFDNDEVDPLTQNIQADIFSVSKQFQTPKTPATQSRKRKRGSEAQSSGEHSPQLPSNPFAGYTPNHELLRPSQLFKATQALTSPLNAVSEGLSDRPSPDIHNLQRPSTAVTLSSPVGLPRAEMVRTVQEPQTTYISVRESQEAREEDWRTDQRVSPEELWDDGFSSTDTQLQKWLNKRRMDQVTRNQFAGVAVRSQPATSNRKRRGRGARRHDQTHSSPLRSGRQATEAVLISDDPPSEEVQGNVTEDETEREEMAEEKGFDDTEESIEENKENVEVPMTVSRLRQITSQVMQSQPTPSHHSHRKSDRVTRTYQATVATSSPTPSRSPERVVASAMASQACAVSDSQSSEHRTEAKMQSRQAQQIHQGPPSSLDTRAMVLQSQLSQVPNSSTAPSNSNKVPVVDNTASETHSTSGRPRQRSPANTDKERCSDEGGDATEIITIENSETHQDRTETNGQPPCGPVRSGPFASTPSSTSRLESVSGEGPGNARTGLSNPSTLYETAKEQLVASSSNSRLPCAQVGSKSKASTQSKSQPLRTIGEIVADPSPPDPIGDIDLEINILSSEDIEFQKVVGRSSPQLPTPIPRRGADGRSLRETKANNLHRTVPGPSPLGIRPTPSSPPSSAFSILTPPQPSSEADARSPGAAIKPTDSKTKAWSPPIEANLNPKKKAQANTTTLSNLENTGQTRVAKVLVKPGATSNTDLRMPLNDTNAPEAVPHKVTQDVNTNGVVAPNQVFAHFNGSVSAFYPATCTDIVAGDEPRYEVTFDDGVKDMISAYGIKRLELRAGDVCKVDLPGTRTKSFVVIGMQDQQRPSNFNTPSRHRQSRRVAPQVTDIFGYASVLVSPKQRQQVVGNSSPPEQITVPLSQVYFTQTMWTGIKDREYNFASSRLPLLTGLQTPSERPSTPSTPSSRARRARSSGMISSRPNSNVVNAGNALFSNMLFTLTNIAAPESLEHTKTQILSNGGRILDSGFDELFYVPNLPSVSSTTESKDESLRLIPSAQNLGFTCLIADRHCRRAKYIQALALGIPCLSTRWVTDCVSKQSILPLPAYLLPSGESTFLHGAVRSRVFDPFPNPSTATLRGLFGNRPRMLTKTSILLIMQKSEEHAMKHHNFLTHALGAACVSRATSAGAAAKAVGEAQAAGEPWDWVYSHDKEKETEKAILSSFRADRRKRGRDSGGNGMGKGRTRVVGNEYVIQSLILGQLVDGTVG